MQKGGQQLFSVYCSTAPEVMRDTMGTVTPESDVFSFGCLMWEVLELSCCLKQPESLRSERIYVSMSEILVGF